MALFVSAGSAIDEGSRGVSIGSSGSNESTDGLAGSMISGLAKPGSGFLGRLGLGKIVGGLSRQLENDSLVRRLGRKFELGNFVRRLDRRHELEGVDWQLGWNGN